MISGMIAPDADDRGRVAPEGDQHRYEQRAERETEHVDALEHAEDAAEHCGDPVRCSSVRPETSNRLRPTFATASSTIASATVGHTAISAIDRP